MGIPHLKVPFALAADGSAQTLEQGSSDEITQCVANLVGTTPGTRYFLPAYGIPNPTFAGLNAGIVGAATLRYEKRATIAIAVTPGGEEVVVVRVRGGTP